MKFYSISDLAESADSSMLIGFMFGLVFFAVIISAIVTLLYDSRWYNDIIYYVKRFLHKIRGE